MQDVLMLMETRDNVDAIEWLKEHCDVDKRIDKDTMIMQIMRECGGLETMYIEIDAFKTMWTLWFRVNRLPISHLCDTLDYVYDPLETYDWKEVGNKVSNSKKLSDTESTGTNQINKSYTDTESDARMRFDDIDENKSHTYGENIKTDNTGTRNLKLENEHHDDTENKVSAYNEDLYQPNTTDTNNGNYTNKDTGTVIDDGTEKHSGTDRDYLERTEGRSESGARVLVHEAGDNSVKTDGISSAAELGRETGAHEKFIIGNNGNFTKQQLIDQERGIAVFNIYEWITAKFKEDNCYRIY